MFRLSARSAFAGIIAGLLSVCVWVVVARAIGETEQAATEAACAKAKATTILFSEQVAGTFSYIDSLMRLTARDLIDRPGTSLKSIIKDNPSAQANLVLMTFADAQGMARETERGLIEPVSLSDREHIRVHLEASKDIGLYIGKPVLGRISGRWSIQLTRGVFDHDGKLAGVLVYSLDPQYFERFYAKLELESSDDIALVGMDGYVRMQGRDTLSALAAQARRSDLVNRARASGSSHFTETLGDTRYQSYVQEIGAFQSLVSARISDRNIKAQVARQTFEIGSFGVVLTALIFGLAIFVARSSTALERLVHERTAELESAVQKLDRMSHTDALTQVPNRRAFDRALQQAHETFLAARTPYALVIADIDHFKRFNDAFGHDVGDLVLCGVAARLLEDCRKEDFVARVGGEEFAMILHGKDPGEAVLIARRLCDGVAAQPIMGHKVTISLGVAPGSAEGFEATYRQADAALYRAKEAGRNTSVLA